MYSSICKDRVEKYHNTSGSHKEGRQYTSPVVFICGEGASTNLLKVGKCVEFNLSYES